jgi:hypothetical protein
MSIYGESGGGPPSDAAAVGGGGGDLMRTPSGSGALIVHATPTELIVPDYSAPAPATQAAMGYDGSSVVPGGQTTWRSCWAVKILPIVTEPNLQPAANELANLQTIVANITLAQPIVDVARLVLLWTTLDNLGDVTSDIIGGVLDVWVISALAATGFFGAKHMDTNLLLLYVCSAAAQTLFECYYLFQLYGICNERWTRPADLADYCGLGNMWPYYSLTTLYALGAFFGYKLWASGAAGTPTVDLHATPAELVSPDRHPAPTPAVQTAMGSDGSNVVVGGPPPQPASGGLAALGLVTILPIVTEPNLQPAANKLANLQTIVANICLGLPIVDFVWLAVGGVIPSSASESVGSTAAAWAGVHVVGNSAATTLLFGVFNIWHLSALAATGFFGAKHMDRKLLKFFACSSVALFLFYGFLSLLGARELMSSEPSQESQPEELSAQELQMCRQDPECDRVALMMARNRAESSDTYSCTTWLPLFLLTTVLGLGALFGYKLHATGAAGTPTIDLPPLPNQAAPTGLPACVKNCCKAVVIFSFFPVVMIILGAGSA